MQDRVPLRLSATAFLIPLAMVFAANGAAFVGNVVDSKTGASIPSRVYIQSASGEWLFPRSTSPNGSAVYYKKERVKASVEMHTTLSAHPFKIDLPPGKYTVTAERGKEYRPLTKSIDMTDKPQDLRLPLERWINVAAHGWYSGDTHVHRTVEDLPNIMLAEDLNVTFPLTYWVTKAYEKPSQGNKNTQDKYGTDLIKIDDTHVIYPRNTEYEIFTVDGKRHTLGAVFVLGHKKVLDFGAPPVKRIAAARDEEGAPLLDLDKHNWPWSMAIMPLLKVDLFELSNNHLWRTKFAFTNWAEPAPPYMKLNYHGTTGAEMAWTRFGFENYYALLNCGFRIQPTGGTASGVHPVPLGFGRVYVQLDDKFNYNDWRRGLKYGRSFVTTGPMLFVEANGRHPGYKWKKVGGDNPVQMYFTGKAINAKPLSIIEILFNGKVVKTLEPENTVNSEGAFESAIDFKTKTAESGWFVARCWQIDDDGRFRFAHTAPWRVEIPGKPLRPRKEQIDYLIQRVKDQIDRSKEVLPESAIAEYEEALKFYEDLATPVK
ncbi:MAG: hypothetical protein ACI8V5_004660 [Limisphaerales bacterium]|jgi:hypothetical protein